MTYQVSIAAHWADNTHYQEQATITSDDIDRDAISVMKDIRLRFADKGEPIEVTFTVIQKNDSDIIVP